jgi:hypothetical protein
MLRTKINARRAHGSQVTATAEQLRQQAFERVRDVHDAVAEMATRLAQDPIFAAGFGATPKPAFKWSAETPQLSSIEVDGVVGYFVVQTCCESASQGKAERVSLTLRICPEWALTKVLGCGWLYAEATPVEGDADDLSGFLVVVEDMLAEFLADVVVSPAADKFLPGLR